MKRGFLFLIVLLFILQGCTRDKEYKLDELNVGDEINGFKVESKYLSEDKREAAFELRGESIIEGELQYGSGLHEDQFVIITQKTDYDDVNIDILFVDEHVFRPSFKVLVIRNADVFSDELKDFLKSGNIRKVKLKAELLMHWSQWESEYINLVTVIEVLED